uniref:Uncharacterized protein n=1 Tax=Anguilla anguilla TaxID=7936 RepID=A0A0E9VD52_ANGAN
MQVPSNLTENEPGVISPYCRSYIF